MLFVAPRVVVAGTNGFIRCENAGPRSKTSKTRYKYDMKSERRVLQREYCTRKLQH